MSEFPIRFTNRLILRKLQVEDFSALVTYANNKKISRYILNIPSPYYEYHAVFRISYVHQGFKENTRYIFAIALKETNEFIGEISLHLDKKNNIAQLAYWLGEQFWSKGYVTEAIHAILRFGFENLSLDLIFATCEAENTGSLRVLEKNNFKVTDPSEHILRFTIQKSAYNL